MDEIQKQPVPAQRLDQVAQNVAVLLAFLLPILFLPTSLMPFAYSKVLLLALAAFVPLTLWVIARFKEGSIMFPNSLVFWLAILLPVAYLVSSLLSGNIANSIVGQGYESYTFVSILFFVALFASASLIFTSVSSVAKMLFAINASFAVLAFIQISRLLFGADNILPSVFSADPTVTLLGSWSDLAVFSGLIVVMSITTIVYASKAGYMRILAYVNTVMALMLLAVVNIKVVWVMLAIMSLLLFVYSLATKLAESDVNTLHERKKSIFTAMSAPVAVFLLSITFVFAGGFIGPKVSTLLNVQYVDVRPSWGGTIEIMKNTYSNEAVFGTGPNTFSTAWTEYKPAGVNNTAFWNIDFRSGVGTIPTAFVTVGLVGGILWLLFVVGIMYVIFRSLWARIPNDATRFVVFASASASVYLLPLLVVYVPQTIMLGITFLMAGLSLSVARNVNAVRTRKLSVQSGQSSSFVLMLTLTTVSIIIFAVSFVVIGRFTAAFLIERSASAANAEDFERATVIATRAQAFTSSAIFGGNDDRASSILSQLAIIKLREAVQADSESEEYGANLQVAIEGVILPATKAVESNPTSYSNHIFLGNVYEQLASIGIDGAYEASLNSYKRAMELNPTNPSIPLRIASVAFKTDNMETAEQYAVLALELKANYADPYFLLSQIAIKGENIEQAIATTESAAILSPNNEGLLFQLGVLQYSIEGYSKAAAMFVRAVNINNDYANALYYLGLSNIKLDNAEGALVAFKRVAELNPENEDIKNIIASIEAGDLTLPEATAPAATAPVPEVAK